MERGPNVETLTDRGQTFTLASTGVKYFQVPAQSAANRRFHIHAVADARLQITLVTQD